MKWIVTGDRRLDPGPVWRVLAAIRPTYLVFGDAPGADHAAFCFAETHKIPHDPKWVADWSLPNWSGGPIRNGKMLAAHPDAAGVLAFPRGGPGTKNCIAQALAAGMLVLQHLK